MKRLVALVLLLSTPVMAQTPTPAAAPKAPTTPMEVTENDIQVLAVALANAGAACDLGAANYCQLLPFRGDLNVKLSAALQKLKAPQGK